MGRCEASVCESKHRSHRSCSRNLGTSVRARNRAPNTAGNPPLNSSVASPCLALSGDLRQTGPRCFA
eukprot:10901238-Alexandrium_andersonii.AAC.1